MLQFIIRRLLIFIPMMALMSVVAFAIIQAPPGDFLSDLIAQLQATGELADESEVEALRTQYGLDQPVYVQYLKWVWGVVRWDLGISLEWRRPVVDSCQRAVSDDHSVRLVHNHIHMDARRPHRHPVRRQEVQRDRLLLHIPVISRRGNAQLYDSPCGDVVRVHLV